VPRNAWLNFATLWVDSELLISMRIDRYGSPMRFASGQSSDLGILNCSKRLKVANAQLAIAPQPHRR
jgi:hypothetical protein